jgi:hypothetical protein
MTGVLLSVADRCDGVRCDMAMLVTRDVFCRTWGGSFDDPQAEFWPQAIAEVRRANPGFAMLAEVYWDMEYALQQLGFDYTYDKRLYDRLRQHDLEGVRRHLWADMGYQRHLARFIENHDEPRAAEVFGIEAAKAAATIAMGLPGMRLFHEGQFEGRKFKVPVQSARRPAEGATDDFYFALLRALPRDGDWKLLGVTNGNFIAYRWLKGTEFTLVVANLSADRGQCCVPLEWPELSGRTWQLRDLLSDARYVREGNALLAPGLYLDVPGYGRHIFEIR